MAVTFRPATKRDLKEFIGPDMVHSAYAVVAEIDGEIVGAGGVYYCGGMAIAFSSFDDRLRDYPIAMARGVKKVMDIVRNHDCLAIADDRYATAPELLSRLGFQNVEGSYFIWRR